MWGSGGFGQVAGFGGVFVGSGGNTAGSGGASVGLGGGSHGGARAGDSEYSVRHYVPIRVGPETPLTTSTKLDVLLVVDDSLGTEPLHQLAGDAADRLLKRLVCEDPADCVLGGQQRRSLQDINVGVITSSLMVPGAGTYNMCSEPLKDGKARLAYADLPVQVPETGLSEPAVLAQRQDVAARTSGGVAQLRPGAEAATREGFYGLVRDMVSKVGEVGCGYEQPLNAALTFLGAPSTATASTDPVLEQHRSRLLRPDAALLVLFVGSEDDCSLDPAAPQVIAYSRPLPAASATCDTDPASSCCFSCGAAVRPSECSPNECVGRQLTEETDPLNLRCWDQQRRFGFSMKRGVDSVMRGLDEVTANKREQGLVSFGFLVGTPWQNVQSPLDSSTPGLPLAAAQLDWSLALGSDGHRDARDPHMRQSRDVRSGVHPLLRTPLVAPESKVLDPISRHERELGDFGYTLQPACIFDWPRISDFPGCTPGLREPECRKPDGSYSTSPTGVAAEPGTRYLAVANALGDRAVVGSVCPPDLSQPSAPTYGYRPWADAVAARAVLMTR